MKIYKSLSIVAEEAINESVKNLFNERDKRKYVDQVWDLLQEAYKTQGGIKGSGFGSKEEMIKKLPMWKLNVVDGVVLCAILYKSSKGDSLRKLAAGGIIREPKELRNLARKKFTDIIKEDFKRSIMEVSGNMKPFGSDP